MSILSTIKSAFNSSLTARAYATREELNVKSFSQLSPETAYELNSNHIKKERLKNFQATIPRLVKTEDVISVYISKTLDSNEFVVTISDCNGNKSSFWVDGGDLNKTLPVRTITSY